MHIQELRDSGTLEHGKYLLMLGSSWGAIVAGNDKVT